jgi:hypothetical protein
VIGKEDQKQTISRFQGLYSRGSVDEVPTDHAQDLKNVHSFSDGRVETRWGSFQTLNLGWNVRQFFGYEFNPPDVNQPVAAPPGVTDGLGFLTLDDSGNIYIGNNGTPVISFGGMDGFSAVNIGNRTYVGPMKSGVAIQNAFLYLINLQTGVARLAAGIAPHTSGSGMTATENTGDGGGFKTAAGIHNFTVIYQTDSGYWTQPGPKLRQAFTWTASSDATQPTVCHSVAHGMSTGESHYIQGSSVGIMNQPWHIIRIDADHFQLPLNTFGLTEGGSPTIDAGIVVCQVNCVGGHTITLTGIPTGPTGTVARLILGTTSGGTEMFFIPNVPGSQSEIDDNSTTTCTVDFFDTDLVASADYLFDNLEYIPAGGGMCKYRGRICIGGPYFPGTEERVILSNVGDYETFNYVSGYVQVQTENDGNVVTCPYVLRDVLYMAKLTGTFSTIDNGGDPSTWAVSVVDDILGCYLLGCTAFTQSQQTASDTGDILAFAHPSGFYIFDGVMRRPELSWKIQSFWDMISFENFFRVQCAHDPWNKRFYIIAPVGINQTDPNTFMMCDYSNGRDKDSVRWYIWTFPFTVSCLGMLYYNSMNEPFPASTLYTLKLGSIQSGKTGLWALDPLFTDDSGTFIASYYVPGPITFDLGGLNFFKLLNFRAWGTGTLDLTLAQEDGQNTVNPPSLNLSAMPGRELQRQINFTNEKMTLKFANGVNAGDAMYIDRVDVWGLMRWPLRPSV